MLETVIMNNGSQFQILTTTHLEFVWFLAIFFQFLAGNHWQEKSLASSILKGAGYEKHTAIKHLSLITKLVDYDWSECQS